MYLKHVVSVIDYRHILVIVSFVTHCKKYIMDVPSSEIVIFYFDHWTIEGRVANFDYFFCLNVFFSRILNWPLQVNPCWFRGQKSWKNQGVCPPSSKLTDFAENSIYYDYFCLNEKYIFEAWYGCFSMMITVWGWNNTYRNFFALLYIDRAEIWPIFKDGRHKLWKRIYFHDSIHIELHASMSYQQACFRVWETHFCNSKLSNMNIEVINPTWPPKKPQTYVFPISLTRRPISGLNIHNTLFLTT